MQEGPNQEPNQGPVSSASGSTLATDLRKESGAMDGLCPLNTNKLFHFFCTNIFKNSSNTVGQGLSTDSGKYIRSTWNHCRI